jgi:phycobilisome rod-core linker protein
MTIPLLEYKPSSQNQRVSGYEVPNEDTPKIYRIEDYGFGGEVEELIWAAYRQLFSEHVILKFYRPVNLESQVKNKAITVRDFIRGLAKSEAFHS